MKTRSKTISIKKEAVPYDAVLPIHIEVCDIRHSPVHFHDDSVELIFCLNGSINILCNHETVTLTEGEIFTIDFGDLHCMYSDSENLVIVMHINLHDLRLPWSYLENVYFACQDLSCPPHQAKPLQTIKNLILAASYLWLKNDGLKPQTAHNIAHEILDVLLEHFDWYNYVNDYPNQNRQLRERFQHIMAYCQANYRNKITISQLAKDVHINENYFSQFLRKSSYGSFSNMMGFIRCYEAQYLLLTTDLSVIDISHKCGFSDDKYFYKSFRYWWKKTPTEHRTWFKEYIRHEDRINSISHAEACKILEPYIAEYYVRTVLN